MLRLFLLVGALLLPPSHAAFAQPAKEASGEVYKLKLENDRVRVYEATFKPGAKMPVHNFPNHLIYMVTDGTLVFEPAGRTGYEMTFKAGETQWFPAQARAMENDSDQEVRLLVVEVKEGAVASRGVKARGKAKGKRKRRR
jgi:quercetin dioxygenase-like cupin family protein